MNQVVTNNVQKPRRFLLLASLLLLLLALTACFGGNDEATSEETALETAAQVTSTLTCSNACLAQGQCGAATDGRSVILAHSSQPALRDHNAILENNTSVTVVGQQTHTIADATGATSTLNFFAVQPVGGGPTNWVAGTCLDLSVQQ